MFERIKTLCLENGLTVTELCKQVTGSSGNLPTWKKGNINPVSLVKIADCFHVSVDYLLGRTDEPTQITGHINGDNSIQTIQDSPVINHQALTEYKQDSVTSEFIKIFEDLNFDDKVELMGLAVKMRKGV